MAAGDQTFQSTPTIVMVGDQELVEEAPEDLGFQSTPTIVMVGDQPHERDPLRRWVSIHADHRDGRRRTAFSKALPTSQFQSTPTIVMVGDGLNLAASADVRTVSIHADHRDGRRPLMVLIGRANIAFQSTPTIVMVGDASRSSCSGT